MSNFVVASQRLGSDRRERAFFRSYGAFPFLLFIVPLLTALRVPIPDP